MSLEEKTIKKEEKERLKALKQLENSIAKSAKKKNKSPADIIGDFMDQELLQTFNHKQRM
jgi:hypothetical protein